MTDATHDAADGEQGLRERLAFERALTSVLRSFVGCTVDRFDACIDDALGTVGRLTGAERAFLQLSADGGQTFEETNTWRRDGDRAAGAAPPQATAAPVTVPIVNRDVVVGYLGLGSSTETDDRSPATATARATATLLDQFAGVVACALERRAAELERRQSEASLRVSEERFKRLVQHSPDVIIVIDALGVFTYASPKIEELLGHRPEDVVGTSALELIHPDEIDDAAVAIANTVEASGEPGEGVGLRVRHRDGTWIPVEVAGSSLLDDPFLKGIVVTVRDMRESVRTAATLEEVEIRFRQVFDYSPIGIALATPAGRFIKVNTAFTRMLDRTADEIYTLSYADVTHPEDVAVNNELSRRVQSGDLADFTLEKRYVRRDGSFIWVRVSVTAVRNAENKALYTIAHVEDITHRKQIEQRLSYDATHDALTGLPLRTLVLDHLDVALANARRHRSKVAVLFLDLDRFKRVNDNLGHAAGDELLKAVAGRLRSAVRSVDTPGRFGGDEFVVVCPDLLHEEHVVTIAERIRQRFEEPVELRGVQVFVGASIGIAFADPGAHPNAELDSESLLRQADTAAYRAKERGRNRYEIFDEELRASVAKRLETESGIRHALDHDELRLLYQPIVRIETGEVVGFEALVRWERDGVLVPPVEFLDVAEETGLIVPLGEVVLDKACRQLATWNRELPEHRVPRLSVNLSARQLTQPELADLVRRKLDENALPAELLCLEITETVLMQDTPQVIATIKALRELGVRLAIDDFGTGYSSLSYLRRLPVSAVKIDRSFILELGGDHEGSTIVASVISLAHALGMEIIAEGVETIEHVAALMNLSCDHAQGFYFSRPLTADAAFTVIRDGILRAA